jgi:hypothetical protein
MTTPLPWVQVATSLPQHRKQRAIVSDPFFARIPPTLEDLSLALVVRLWMEAGRARTGYLAHYTPMQIANIVLPGRSWTPQRAEQLVARLVAIQVLDGRKSGVRFRNIAIHGWYEWTGREAGRRARGVDRARAWRREHQAGQALAHDKPGSSVTRNVRIPNAHVTRETRVYKSREENKRLESRQRPPTTQTQTLFHHSQTPGQDPPQPDSHELGQIYHQQTGQPVHAGIRAYLAKLATKYGAAEVAGMLATHGSRIAGAANGLQYLSGILATRRREGRRPIGMAPPYDGVADHAPPPRPVVSCAGGCGTRIVPLASDPVVMYCTPCQLARGES